jgi:hypothetical protein
MVTNPSNPQHQYGRQNQHRTGALGVPKIKVTVHIPDIVPRRQEKINRIYDILSPARPAQKAM